MFVHRSSLNEDERCFARATIEDYAANKFGSFINLAYALIFQVMQLVGSLYILYFPYCGFILWEACSVGNQHRLHEHPRLVYLASLLLACSPPINGLLYGLKSQTLRRSVQNYWRKKATKSELQQVIMYFRVKGRKERKRFEK